jgi:hypothetical protein
MNRPRDLEFPEDARRAHTALIKGLEYDAAVALVGNRLAQVLSPTSLPPPPAVPVVFGPEAAQNAVMRDFEGLMARFALLSMIGRFEGFAQGLLLQRRFIERWLKGGRKTVPGPELLAIRKRVRRDIMGHSLDQVPGLLVAAPSPELRARSRWLAGFYAVRNCLVHRQGHVQLEDADSGDEMRVVWPQLRVIVDGQEIVSVPHHVGGDGQGEVQFEDTERTWRIDDLIHMTPRDCQSAGLALVLLGGEILREFEREVQAMLV